jgi:hypothetical protein
LLRLVAQTSPGYPYTSAASSSRSTRPLHSTLTLAPQHLNLRNFDVSALPGEDDAASVYRYTTSESQDPCQAREEDAASVYRYTTSESQDPCQAREEDAASVYRYNASNQVRTPCQTRAERAASVYRYTGTP